MEVIDVSHIPLSLRFTKPRFPLPSCLYTLSSDLLRLFPSLHSYLFLFSYYVPLRSSLYRITTPTSTDKDLFSTNNVDSRVLDLGLT